METFLKILEILAETAEDAFNLFLHLPVFIQIVLGILIAVFILNVWYKSYVWWMRIKSLRAGKVYWK